MNKFKEGLGEMLCEYKNDIMYISLKTLELFKENYPDEYDKVKILKIHPEYVNYEKLVKLMNKEELIL